MGEAIVGLFWHVVVTAALGQSGGDGEGFLGIPPAGGYTSILKIIVMAAFMIPWTIASPWVYRDAKRVRASQVLWGGLMLGVGAASFVIWLLLPYYMAGLLLYLLMISALFISYIAYRNGRVDEDQRIHILAMFLPQSKEEQVKVFTKVRVYNDNSQIIAPPPDEAGAEIIKAYNLTQDMLYDMVWRRASEAEIAPVSGQQANVRFVIDGVVSSRPARSLAESEAIIQYLKPKAGMSAEEHRRPQKGRITVDMAGTPIEIMLATDGTTGGQRMQFRVVQEFVQTDLGDLGIEESMLDRVRRLNRATRGLFIICGGSGSGITSTLYSLLREQDAFMKQLVTLEAEVSINLENITQHAYGKAFKVHDELASALRRDPDIIMVDRCPDAETAKLICRAAAKKFVLLGIHAKDSFSALDKWVSLCGDTTAAVTPLGAIMCQMLVRKLCTQCREPYKPDPQLLAKANIAVDKIDVFFRPPTKPLVDEKGHTYICHACQGSGYFGRTAAFELLEVTDDIKKLVLEGASPVQVRGAARKKKMLYLQEQVLRKVISRETSIQEVIRVSHRKES